MGARARVREGFLAGLPWLSLSGAREAVFAELGRWGAPRIATVQRSLPERDALRRWAATPAGRARLTALHTETSARFPEVMAELSAMADGAGQDRADLSLSNVRGDVGVVDGTGCTDLAWRRTRSLVAHNEDGAPALADTLVLLTLRLDDEAPVFAQWYPGFLPCNAFVATGHGLVWGIDHLPVARPGPGSARHAVARQLRRAVSLDEAVDLLRRHPMAGGFAFTIGELTTGRVAVVESAAGHVAVHLPGPADPFSWHANHTCHLPTTSQPTTDALGPLAESQQRGRFLATLALPEDEPDVDWFLKVLTGAELPDGALRTARGTDPLMTLCTTVTDLDSGDVTLRSHRGDRAETHVDALLAGPR